MKTFPVFLKVSGRRIVIVGGGEKAAQKCRLALKTDASILVIADAPDPELTALAEAGRIEISNTPPRSADFVDAALVFVATEDGCVDAAAGALARAAGAVVNVVDAPELSSAFVPSIVDRDPVVVAIGTEGAAPVLARQIKSRVEEMLEPRLGDLAALAGRLRAEAGKRLPPRSRRALWSWVFGGAPRSIHASGGEREAARMIKDAIAGAEIPDDATNGFVSLVGAGAGSADLITLRGVNRLQAADIIFYDRLVDPEIMELARRDAERVFVGKTPGVAAWPQNRINGVIVAAARSGKRVVRLKCGDPGVFARGAEEAKALSAAGIEWEIVPGVTAACIAAASINTFLTERGVTDTVVLATGQTEAGAPAPEWANYLRQGATVALYMAVRTAPDVQRRLLDAGHAGATEIDVVSNAGAPNQRHIATTLHRLADDMAAHEIQNPAMLLIRRPKAQVAALSLAPELPVAVGVRKLVLAEAS